jgi:hypothetical protein
MSEEKEYSERVSKILKAQPFSPFSAVDLLRPTSPQEGEVRLARRGGEVCVKDQPGESKSAGS